MSRFNFIVLLLGVLFWTTILPSKVFSSVIKSAESPAFELPTKDYVDDPNTKTIVTHNMPSVHSQDGLPLCCSEAARTLWMQNGCKTHQMNDCSISDSHTPSVLSLAGIANEGTGGLAKPNNPVSIEYCSGKDCDSPGEKKIRAPDIAYILKMANLAGEIYPESCYSVDKFAQKYNNGSPVDEAAASQQALLKLKENYDKATKLEAVSVCLECLKKELSEDFMLVTDISDIADALKEKSFDRFLHRVLIGGCTQPKVKFNLAAFSLWPKEKLQKLEPTVNTLSKITDTLKTNTPIGISLCIGEKPNGDIDKCKSGRHCVVISGYKKVCSPTSGCMNLLKIENSWGTDWQHQNNEGWVNAETLIEYSDVGRSSQLFSFDP